MTELNLWKQRLGRVPDDLWHRTDLTRLILADNDLSGELDERIGNLTQLRMLDLGHNQLVSLPHALGALTELEFLYVHDNRLTTLPALRLRKLRYLNASENVLTVRDVEIIGILSSLVELRLTDNQLSTLPRSFERLTQLRELHLRNNALTTLPDGVIGALTELRHLDLRGNPLTDLPSSLATLPRLDKLDLRWVTTLPPSTDAPLRQLEERGCLVYR